MSIEQRFYSVLNPSIKWLLRSPWHFVASSNLMVINFRGKKTGRELSTPVRYANCNEGVCCLTAQHYGWWRNFRESAPVTLDIRRKTQSAHALAYEFASDIKLSKLTAFFAQHPQDCKFYGIRRDGKGANLQDLSRRLDDIIYIEFKID